MNLTLKVFFGQGARLWLIAKSFIYFALHCIAHFIFIIALRFHLDLI
jgi:hypothetical protein